MSRIPWVKRAAAKWLIFIAVAMVTVAAPGAGLGTTPIQADTPPIDLLVCRANVDPCQSELSIPIGGTVLLDLILDLPIEIDATGDPLPVVAWETHHVLTDGSVAEIQLNATSGQPVQEQRDPILFLDRTPWLNGNPVGVSSGYFTVQNQYDSASGQLDYTVTLTNFNPTGRPSGMQLDHNHPRAVIGRIVIKGNNLGASKLLRTSAPAQVITLDRSDNLVPIEVSASASPTANIKVGPVTTTEFRVQLALQDEQDNFPSELAVTLWQPGAVPPWLGGSDVPAAGFRRLSTDASGAFRIGDVPSSLLPPGAYDLRVKGSRSLTRVLRNITVPTSGGSQQVVSIVMPQLRPGDINGDNVVDSADVQNLRNGFGQSAGETDFNDTADFNQDNIIDVADFSRLSRNFGARGE
ncbi:MAG: dockerin type I domain-containing protein [Chloroflexi bacterium]|nr:dockerin type I domain-containing protein [Chloroflexota bacterium]